MCGCVCESGLYDLHGLRVDCVGECGYVGKGKLSAPSVSVSAWVRVKVSAPSVSVGAWVSVRVSEWVRVSELYGLRVRAGGQSSVIYQF